VQLCRHVNGAGIFESQSGCIQDLSKHAARSS
jgi:hypothetical protein